MDSGTRSFGCFLVTHRCKMGSDMWDMWTESHRCQTSHAHACISCNGDVLYPPYTLFKCHSWEKSGHSPQGVETGDLRSSRHMPQVNSDMLFPRTVSGCYRRYPCRPRDRPSWFFTKEYIETRRDSHRDHHVRWAHRLSRL